MTSARLLLSGAIVLLMAATPAGAADNYVVADQPPPPHKVVFVDQRPPKEIKGGLPLLFNPTYSVPDKRISPGLLDLLGAALEARLGDRLDGKQVTITRLQLQNYFMATYQHSQAMTMGVTSAVSNATLVAVQDGNAVDAVIFRAAGTVDGKEFKLDYALPYDAGKFGGMVYNGQGARAKTREVVAAAIPLAAAEIERVLQ